MIAKIIVHGRDRQEAIARMRRTLEMTVIEGIKTSIPLHLKILAEPDFVAGRLSTAFMERFLVEKKAERRPRRSGLIAGLLEAPILYADHRHRRVRASRRSMPRRWRDACLPAARAPAAARETGSSGALPRARATR